MMRRILAGCLAAFAFFAVAGCGTTELKSKRNITVPLDIGKTRTNLAVKVADLVTVQLPPVELAGYGWQIFLLDARYLKQKTEVTHPAGNTERPTVTFLALKPTEKTTARFLLVKLDGAKDQQPIDGHDAVFSIEL